MADGGASRLMLARIWHDLEPKQPLTPHLRRSEAVHMAVAVGFEPTVGLTPHIISSDAPSAARTRHRAEHYRRVSASRKQGSSSWADAVASEGVRR